MSKKVRNRVDQASYIEVPGDDTATYELMGTGFNN